MSLEFSDKEILTIYGHFKKELVQLEIAKSDPNCPMNKKSINEDIKLYSPIVERIEKGYPNLPNLFR